ncbi:MAG: helix-turn-helix transcriptional regulator [Spirochaetes bacterium]|nr:helix-turn-helix transcriptional regulator [Spirochaetota bacterium]
MDETTVRKKAIRHFHHRPELVLLYEQFPLLVLRTSFKHAVASHIHDFFEIDMLLKGSAYNESGGIRRLLKAGDIALGDHVHPHTLTPRERITMLSVKFRQAVLPPRDTGRQDTSLLMPFIADVPGFRAKLAASPEARTTMLRIAGLLREEYCRRASYWKESAASLLEALLLSIYRAFSEFAQEHNLPLNRNEHAIVERLVTHIDTHYTEDLKIAGMLRKFGISASHAAEIFKRVSGSSLKEFLIERRISAARRMLTITDEPVLSVCFASGFGNLSNFNRVFHYYAGMSPREYRDQTRNKQNAGSSGI